MRKNWNGCNLALIHLAFFFRTLRIDRPTLRRCDHGDAVGVAEKPGATLKHWEEGDDLSLLEFKTIEYKRKGYAIATEEQLARITKLPKRELIRRGINQHTLEKICKREPVRTIKLAKCLKVLEEYEAHRGR